MFQNVSTNTRVSPTSEVTGMDPAYPPQGPGYPPASAPGGPPLGFDNIELNGPPPPAVGKTFCFKMVY